MSKSKVVEMQKKVAEQIKNQFNTKGEEMNEEQNEAMVEEVKERRFDMKKIGIVTLGVLAVSGIAYGIYKALTSEHVENVIMDTDWQEVAEAATETINPAE